MRADWQCFGALCQTPWTEQRTAVSKALQEDNTSALICRLALLFARFRKRRDTQRGRDVRVIENVLSRVRSCNSRMIRL